MKRKLLCILFVLALTGAVPFLLMLLPGKSPAPESTPRPTGLSAHIPVWDEGRDELLNLTVREYLIGAAAAELPADWPEDAVKAQMVAAHSWALYQKAAADPAKQGAYFSVDPALRQGYLTPEVRQSYWGTAAVENEKRLDGLARQVEDALVLYHGQPALTCWHAISCGHTQASQNVWQEALPYLQGVESPLDRQAPDYEVQAEYSAQQVYDALVSGAGVTPPGSPATWFSQPETDDAGYVRTLRAGGALLSGTALRETLRLRSAAFSISYDESCGMFTFTTRGYGHGVGLSQYGAYFLAQNGQSWQQILQFYYPGTTVSQ